MINKLKTKKELTKQEIYETLLEFLEDCQTLSLRELRREENFEKGSWSEFLAFQLGMQKAFQKVIEFIPQTTEKPH